MSINKAVDCGIIGNEISKTLMGTSEVSTTRTGIATGGGYVVGSMASGALIIAGVSAPVVVPLAAVSALCGFFASRVGL